MSIYNKSISDINADDLKELLGENAVENIRLEFKRNIPDKDNTLKKLSSFANTYGGFLIIGAEENKGGRLNSLPGVDKESGYKQKIIQWCQGAIYPPITPFISDPIPSISDGNKFYYVIFVGESAESPHFINSRKGIYVRTDEFSHRYEAQLATYNEIQHLANRRKMAIERRANIIKRAEYRFETYVSSPSKATLNLAICPEYPVERIINQKDLFPKLKSNLISWRRMNFPITSESKSITQIESAIIFDTFYNKSMMEFNEWGLLQYLMQIEEKDESKVGGRYIHLPELIGNILLCLKHAGQIYSAIGFNGMFYVEVKFKHIRNLPFFFEDFSIDYVSKTVSKLDDNFKLDISVSLQELVKKRDIIVVNILKIIFHSMNFKAGEKKINRFLGKGYIYNSWAEPEEKKNGDLG